MLEGRASRIFKFREKLLKKLVDNYVKVNHITEIPKLSMKRLKIQKFENLDDAKEHLFKEFSINLSSYNF